MTEPGLVVYRFDAPLFFVNADRFRERITQILADNPGEADRLVLDFEGGGALDTTAIDVLAEILGLADLGVVVVAVARANDHVLASPKRASRAARRAGVASGT